MCINDMSIYIFAKFEINLIMYTEADRDVRRKRAFLSLTNVFKQCTYKIFNRIIFIARTSCILGGQFFFRRLLLAQMQTAAFPRP